MAKSNEERVRFANDEILGKGNLGVVDEIFATDYVVHAGGKDYKGHKFVRRFVGQLRSAIPNLRVVEVVLLIQAGDTIAWQRTLRGTHEGEMMGGRKVECTTVSRQKKARYEARTDREVEPAGRNGSSPSLPSSAR